MTAIYMDKAGIVVTPELLQKIEGPDRDRHLAALLLTFLEARAA